MSSVSYEIYIAIYTSKYQTKYSENLPMPIKARVNFFHDYTATKSQVMSPTAITVKGEVTQKAPSEKTPQTNTHEDDEENDVGEDEVGEEGLATGECVQLSTTNC